MDRTTITKLKGILPSLTEYLSGKVTLRKQGDELHGRCPKCGGDDKTSDRFYIKSDGKRYTCRQCEFHGDILDAIDYMEGKSVADLLRENNITPETGHKDNRKVGHLPAWKYAVTDHETIHRYFSNRGIFFKANESSSHHIRQGIPPSIRYSEFEDKNGKGLLRSVLCAVTNINKDSFVRATSRVYLDDDNNRTDRIMRGQFKDHGRGVWFFRKEALKTKELIVGEGIETVLSAMQATDITGVAGCTNAVMMGIEFPDNIEILYILVDEDIRKKHSRFGYTGQKKSIELAKKFEESKQGRIAYIVAPSETTFSKKPEKKDFNDLKPEEILDRFDKKYRLSDEVISEYKAPDKKKKSAGDLFVDEDNAVLDDEDDDVISGVVGATPVPNVTKKALERVNNQYASVLLAGKFRILKEEFDRNAGKHTVSFLEKQSFIDFLRIKKVPVYTGIDMTGIKYVPLPQVWLDWEKRRSYSDIAFAPGNDVKKDCYNLFRGFGYEPKKGDCSMFKRHLKDVICSGNSEHYKYLMAWMARIVQDPGGKKPGVAVVLQGGKGTGKGTFVEYFGKIFAEAYIPIYNQRSVTGRFNMHLSKCLLVFLDEALWGGNKEAEGALKSLITEDTVMFEPKGIDTIKMKSYINFIVASNEPWVIPATEDERRFLVLEVSSDFKQDNDYFSAITAERDNGGIEALMYELANMDISGVNLFQAPKTDALAGQVSISFSPVKKFWHSILDRGYLLSDPDKNLKPRVPDGCPVGEEGRVWTSEIFVYELYAEFCVFCKQLNLRNFNNQAQFIKDLNDLWPGEIEIVQRDYDDSKKIIVYPKEEMVDYFTELTGIEIKNGAGSEPVPF